jgi:hypothetical protein
MIDLQVEIRGDDIAKHLLAVSSQLDYATSVAINNTLNDIQKDERAHIHQTFTLRRPDFIDRSVYIGPQDRARKDRLVGIVRINPKQDVLAKFEDGGRKSPQASASVAVPIVRAGDPLHIFTRGDPLSVRRLMQTIETKRQYRRRRGGSRLSLQEITTESVYLVKSARGTFIIAREGPGQTRVLWAFKRSVPIEPSLRFKEIALETALRVWPTRAAEAIAHAIETAR